MIRTFSGGLGALARAAVVVAAAFVAGCGSGAVSSPPTTPTIQPITVTPSTATLYSETPTNLILSGGNGTYVITSSDQAALPIAGTFTGEILTLVPNPVAADTPVTLTVRDTGTSAPVTANLTVKPRTISNVVTITPSSSQSSACGTALCAGGDAAVKVVLTRGGLPLANRKVDFQVVSGDVKFISGGGSNQEILLSAISATTDAAGIALVRIRAAADAPAQTALIQVSDASSGFTQRASVTIAPAASAALAVNPTTLSFQGVTPGTCASNVSADVIVTGGKPPYQASQPTGYTVSPSVVTASGGRFTISPTGQCNSGTSIAIVDSAGASVTITAGNQLSAATTLAFSLAPSNVSLNTCNDAANVVLIGGSGVYVASSGNGAISATVSGTTGVIRRNAGSAPGTSSVIVSFSDGRATQNVTVSLTGEALGSCPAPAGAALSATPSTVTLTACSDVANVSVSGGSGHYTESPSSSAIQIGGSASFFTISRATSSTAVASPQYVEISDGSTTLRVPVNLKGEAAGTCVRPPSNALTLSPNAVTLSECSSSPSVVISGGTGSYTASASNTGITATVNNNVLTIRRALASPAITTSNACPVSRPGNQCVTVNDGFSTDYVGVTVTGAGAGGC